MLQTFLISFARFLCAWTRPNSSLYTQARYQSLYSYHFLIFVITLKWYLIVLRRPSFYKWLHDIHVESLLSISVTLKHETVTQVGFFARILICYPNRRIDTHQITCLIIISWCISLAKKMNIKKLFFIGLLFQFSLYYLDFHS